MVIFHGELLNNQMVRHFAMYNALGLVLLFIRNMKNVRFTQLRKPRIGDGYLGPISGRSLGTV